MLLEIIEPNNPYGKWAIILEDSSCILLTLKYLYDETDIDHDVTSKSIMRMLEPHGIKAPDKRTIEADIDQIIHAGHDIEKNHRNGVLPRYIL